LIKRTKRGDGITIHRLMQAVIRHELEAHVDYSLACSPPWVNRFKVFFGFGLTPLEAAWKTVVRLLWSGFPSEAMEDRREVCRRLSNQILNPLLEIPLYNWNELQEILDSFGDFLLDEGRFQAAEAIFTKLTKIDAYFTSRSSRDMLWVMGKLACTYEAQGRLNRAAALCEIVLRARTTVLGAAHHETMYAKETLGRVYYKLGREEGIYIMERVLKARMTIPALKELRCATLESMAALAWGYDEQGRIEEAITLSEEVLHEWRFLCGERNPFALKLMSELGWRYCRRGVLEGVTHSERALEVSECVLGVRHPSTLKAMVTLGWVYRKLKRHEKAVELQKKAVRLMEEVYGKSHPTTLEVRIRLKEVLWEFRREDVFARIEPPQANIRHVLGMRNLLMTPLKI
jgi:tetratricopeptide (TPR) repeat protein